MQLTNEQFGMQVGSATPVRLDETIDWSYRFYSSQERDDIIIDLIRRLDEKNFSIVTGDRSRWLKGWKENLYQLKEKGFDALVPAYVRRGLPLRMYGNFIKSTSPYFERNWLTSYRRYLFTTYLKGYPNIFEFGSGSGINVHFLSTLFPEASITGLDWVQPSVDIIDHFQNLGKLNVKGRMFNFFSPDYSLEIPENSAFLTMGAMEQTGTDYHAFLSFIFDKKPALVVHSEPILEFYGNTLPDFLAKQIHITRNFWRGYLEQLHILEEAKKITIIKEHRTGFGSLLLEGYSQLIWRPL